MRINNQLSEAAILSELGGRLARLRLDRNLTQQELAAEAGVSKETLQRLERGHSVTMNGLLRLLRALDLLEALDALVPEPLPSPIEQLDRAGGQRRRAAGAHSPRRREQADGWSWGTR
ncbi:MAG: helix-turn-helix transcriptional regulator [Solirubrobacteraceae bacterium]|jgi:transcriptional regulator with XRE-family HTH domain